MDDAEKKYAEDMKAQGIDIPDLEEGEDEKPEPEVPAKAPDAGKPKEPTPKEKSEGDEHLQTPKEQRKRSIYDEYKEKKAEARTEKERADGLERELQILREKAQDAETPEEKKEAKDDLEAFADEIKADPVALKRMRELFLKDLPKSEVDPELKKQLHEFTQWRTTNSAVIEKSMFDDEFKQTTPKLEKMFGKISPDEQEAIKSALDKLSHSKEWHDKSLAYIAFENEETLSALVSPKKRGMESRGRKDAAELDTDFDPNADIASMTPTQREAWEKEYREAGQQAKGIVTDARGKKTFV